MTLSYFLPQPQEAKVAPLVIAALLADVCDTDRCPPLFLALERFSLTPARRLPDRPDVETELISPLLPLLAIVFGVLLLVN